MFEYWKKIDALHHINRILLAVILILLLINTGLFSVIMTAPKRMEFWLSPNLSANGGLMKSGEVPDEYVHGFVSTLLPTLNTWKQSEKSEFSQNLEGFYYYFTPRHQQLMQETLTAFQDAQLFNRTQVASLYRFMEPKDIQQIAHDTWEVHITLRITQRLNDSNPMVISDKVVDYHVRVVRVATSKLQNPFQLALDGYTQPETLRQDLLSPAGESHDQ